MKYLKILLNKFLGFLGYTISKKYKFQYPPEANYFDLEIFKAEKKKICFTKQYKYIFIK